MIAAKGALDVFINLNFILGFAYLIWLGLSVMLARSSFKNSYSVQLRALKTLLLLVAISPLLAMAATSIMDTLSPGRSLVLSDMVVATYLRGGIGIDAIQFEAMLNTRSMWVEGLVGLETPVMAIFAGLLGVGIIYSLSRFIRSVLGVRRLVLESYLWKRVGPVDIRLSNRVAVPMAARGLRRRHVIFPTELTAGGMDRKMALAHEMQHFRDGDIEWEIAIELLRPLFFWNPAFVLLKRQFDRLRELSCDEAVLVNRRFEPLEYAQCLLRFCERAVTVRALRPLNVALVATGRKSARRELANRLLSLSSAGGGAKLKRIHGLVLASVLGVTVSVAGAAIHSPKDWSHDRLMLSTVVNLERLEVINQGF